MAYSVHARKNEKKLNYGVNGEIGELSGNLNLPDINLPGFFIIITFYLEIIDSLGKTCQINCCWCHQVGGG